MLSQKDVTILQKHSWYGPWMECPGKFESLYKRQRELMLWLLLLLVPLLNNFLIVTSAALYHI